MYDFNQHKHNYSVWTAARAVQRGFTSTSIIESAINQTGLRKYAEDAETVEDFENFHRRCCNQLIQYLQMDIDKKVVDKKLAGKEATDIKVCYGRAAKIVSIYLKTSVILPNHGQCKKSKLIHPPIDNIILKNIIQKHPTLKMVAWTKLGEDAYWKLVADLKQIFPGAFDRTLEKYWNPADSDLLEE